MNRYTELMTKQAQEREEANLLGFAFSKGRFAEIMNGWGLNPEKKSDLEKVASLGSGTYILKENIECYKEMSRRHSEELKAEIEADKTGEGFIYQMFYRELCNHEYGYTGDAEDALDALGYKWEQVQNDPLLKRGFEKASSKIMEQEE